MGAFRSLGLAGLGASVMFLFDRDSGRRRRARLGNKLDHYVRETRQAYDTAIRDLRHRAFGLAARSRRRFQPAEAASADVLAARVRSAIGRCVSHPHAVEVHCTDAGRVTLAGHVLAREASALVKAARKVPGVHQLDDRLERHHHAGNVPSLQGQQARPDEHFRVTRGRWTPARRLLGTTGGSLLAAAGAALGGPLGLAASVAGIGLFARATSGKPLPRLLGIGGGRRGFDFQKTLDIDAPVERVWTFCRSFENFPRFMSHVRSVRDLGGGRSHWVVDGPAHLRVEWDAEISREETNRILAWKTAPESVVGHAGVLRFEDAPDGRCRLALRMTYNPPAGALGHAIAKLFGSDPKKFLDDDLLRLKSLLERGRTRAHGASVTSEELGASREWERPTTPLH